MSGTLSLAPFERNDYFLQKKLRFRKLLCVDNYLCNSLPKRPALKVFLKEEKEEIMGLSSAKIMEYIREVVSIETSVYSQKQIVDKVDKEEKAVKFPQRPVEIKPEIKNTPSVPQEPVVPRNGGGMFLLICALISIGGGILGVSWGGMVFGGVFLIIAGVVILLFLPKVFKEAHEKYDEEWAKYYKKQASYSADVDAVKAANANAIALAKKEYDERLQEYSKEQIKAQKGKEELSGVYTKLSALLGDTSSKLEEIYSLDIVHPKYRNMIAMCTILEYFETGRVSELAGPNGAYNLYESELRQNLIINKLDTVISQLDQVKNNQYTLYKEISTANETIRSMANNISAIADDTRNTAANSAITAYYSGITAYNTGIIKWQNAFK